MGCIVYYTYYIILCINTDGILPRHNTGLALGRAFLSHAYEQAQVYVEPAIGWNTEDNKAGVIKFGVADYEPRKSSAKIIAPTRPALPPPPEPPQELLTLPARPQDAKNARQCLH